MKVINTSPNKVVNSQDFEKHSFGIKTKNLHYIIGLLRNDLYSDKLLAIIREYACNAFDANVEAGNGNKPIRITLPSKLEPTFKVRDFGPGLSKEDVVDIFISYGESSKRNTNAQIGQMGIGSKAGFCYGDSFTVTSYNNGTKTVYDCVLDSNDVGDCLVLFSEPSNEPEGLEIAVNIKVDDVNEFNSRAFNFFKYWGVTPEFVGFDNVEDKLKDVTFEESFSGTNWTIYNNKERGYYGSRNKKTAAVMGNIAYPIDWKNVRFDKIVQDQTLFHTEKEFETFVNFIKESNIVINFDIGEVQFSPSRESLQYTDYTNNSFLKIIKSVAEEITDSVQSEFDKCKNLVEACDRYDEFFSYYGTLNDLKNYFKGKLKYKGKIIESNCLEEVNRFHPTMGYIGDLDKVHSHYQTGEEKMFTGYDYRSRTSRIQKENSRWGSNKVEIGSNVRILNLDTEKRGYLNKAVKHLFESSGTDAQGKTKVNKVWVMRLLSTKAKKDAYSKLRLKELESIITNYSDIHDKMKPVRVGRRVVKGNRTPKDMLEVKKITVDNDSYSRYYRNTFFETPYREMESEVVNLNDNTVRYYLRVDYLSDSKKCGKTSDGKPRPSLYNIVKCLNKSNKTKFEVKDVYVVTDRSFNSVKFQKNISKWVPIEKYVDKTIDKLLTNTKFSNEMASAKVLCDLKDTYRLKITCLNKLVELLKVKNTAFHYIKDNCVVDSAVDIYSDDLVNYITKYRFDDITKNNQLYKKLVMNFNSIAENYPMLESITDGLNYRYTSRDEFPHIARYIELERIASKVKGANSSLTKV